MLERDEYPTILFGLKFTFADEHTSRRNMFSFGIDDAHQLAGIADRQDRRELAFLDQGPAALATGEDLDDPDSLAIEFRKFDRFAVASIVFLSVRKFAFDVGDHAIEIQRRRDRGLLLAQNVPSIESIDSNEELGSVLQIER